MVLVFLFVHRSGDIQAVGLSARYLVCDGVPQKKNRRLMEQRTSGPLRTIRAYKLSQDIDGKT
jgi:hypothetical protein